MTRRPEARSIDGPARGRSARHALIGLGLTAGAVALSAAIARLTALDDDDAYEAYSDYEDPNPPARSAKSRLLDAVRSPPYLALTVSGLWIGLGFASLLWRRPQETAATHQMTVH